MRKSTKIFIEIMAIYTAVGTIAILIAMLYVRPPEIDQPAGYVAEPKVTAAMSYHGDKFNTFSDENGVLWFKRDGQTCKLFTGAFLEYWMKRIDHH